MKDIYQILQELGIIYKEHKHPAVFTVEQAEKHRQGMSGASVKNLFLRNKKGNQHYLLIVGALKKVSLKEVEKAVQEKNLSFASPERLDKYLKLKPGSVSPCGLINDENKEVIVLLDKELMQNERLTFHPVDNTSTIELSKADFLKFLNWCGNEYQEIEI